MNAKINEALEMAMAARMNLENLNHATQGLLSQSPFFSITAMQVDEVISILKASDDRA